MLPLRQDQYKIFSSNAPKENPLGSIKFGWKGWRDWFELKSLILIEWFWSRSLSIISSYGECLFCNWCTQPNEWFVMLSEWQVGLNFIMPNSKNQLNGFAFAIFKCKSGIRVRSIAWCWVTLSLVFNLDSIAYWFVLHATYVFDGLIISKYRPVLVKGCFLLCFDQRSCNI